VTADIKQRDIIVVQAQNENIAISVCDADSVETGQFPSKRMKTQTRLKRIQTQISENALDARA